MIRLGAFRAYWRGWNDCNWFVVNYDGEDRHAAMAKLFHWIWVVGPIEFQRRRRGAG